MNIEWILERDIFEENLDSLKEAIKNNGMTYQEVTYIPFNGGFQNMNLLIEDENEKDIKYFAYGSLNMISRFQNTDLRYWVDSYCNKKQFECTYYYPRFRHYLYNYICRFIPFGCVEDYFRASQYTRFFIRPNSGMKPFSGMVVENSNDWKKIIDRDINLRNVDPEELCLLTKFAWEPTKEYRVVIGRDFESGANFYITSSLYMVDGVLESKNTDDNDQLKEFVEEVLENVEYSPDPFWIMDIAEDDNEVFSVLEVNSMSCSGLYECDINKTVESLKEYWTDEYNFLNNSPNN